MLYFYWLLFFLSGCTKQTITEKDRAITVCINACNEAKAKGQNLESGPCLLNPMQAEEDFPNLSKWVCDVAYSPRQAVDNQIENQCSAFREGKANHFVDPNCQFIKSY